MSARLTRRNLPDAICPTQYARRDVSGAVCPTLPYWLAADAGAGAAVAGLLDASAPDAPVPEASAPDAPGAAEAGEAADAPDAALNSARCSASYSLRPEMAS
ncbi:protein of unknown function [Pararobbsia alpina]